MADDCYWHDRFAREGNILGETPSTTVKLAVEHFPRAKVEHVLVPGCAYGRNALDLARSGFRVTGLDSCETALSVSSGGWWKPLAFRRREGRGSVVACGSTDTARTQSPI